jgi:hypothetical protein
MCSQRLPRPGRLCRECEQELNLGRSSASTLGGTLSADPDADARLGLLGAGVRLPRSTIVVSAFVAGVTLAAAVYALNPWPATRPRGSVMIDRDLSAIPARAPHRSAAGGAAGGMSGDVASRAPARTDDAPVPVPVVATASATDVQSSTRDERAASTASQARVAYDRVLGLANALDGCAPQSPFARLACEQRARARYCEGADGRIPQCTDAPAGRYGP